MPNQKNFLQTKLQIKSQKDVPQSAKMNEVEQLCVGLTLAQKSAVVMSPDRPLILIASAGSGKTLTLTKRVAFFLQQEISGHNILALTFTRKAADEMKSRIMNIIDWKRATSVTVSNFHQLSLRILREHHRTAGLSECFTVLGAQDQHHVVETCIQHFQRNQRESGRGNVKLFVPENLAMSTADEDAIIAAQDELPLDSHTTSTVSSESNIPSSVVDYYSAFIRKAKRNGQRPSDFVLEHRAIYTLYVQQLKQQNAIDFSDMTPLAIHLLEKRPALLEEYRTTFTHILVDEYQDVSAEQFNLLILLSGPSGRITVCGDDDQSVYGWRGGSVKSFDLFERNYSEARTIVLEQNFRSSKKIIQLSQHVIEFNTIRRKKILQTENGEGETVKFILCPDPKAEAAKIVHEIRRRRSADGARWSDFSVLARTRFSLKAVGVQLKNDGIPMRINAGSKRSPEKSREVQDLLAYIDLVTSAKPMNSSFERVSNVPKRSIGSTTMQSLQETASLRQQTLFEVASSQSALSRLGGSRQSGAVLQFVRLLNRLRQTCMCSTSLQSNGELLLAIIEQTHYMAYIEATASDETAAGDRKANVSFLGDFIAADSTGHTLAQSAVRIRDKKIVSTVVNNPDVVTLSTVHQAKGREWNAVFVVRVNTSQFPLSFREDSKDGLANTAAHSVSGDSTLAMTAHVEEERRLFFVALTRAKHTLYISCVQTDDKGQQMTPSRFIEEIAPNLLEKTSSKISGNISTHTCERGEPLHTARSDEKSASNKREKLPEIHPVPSKARTKKSIKRRSLGSSSLGFTLKM